MPKETDPFYNRKQVPDDFIEHVGYTGLTKTDETMNRERKYSAVDGSDLRKFSNPKAKDGKLDPYYQRKQVPTSLIDGVGDTGLSKEEEYNNRERKFSTPDGGDLRKFSNPKTKDGKLDPYYQRKQVAKPVIHGVGETGQSRAEDFETRENKAALFDESSDPFQLITGRGHRQSVSGIAGPGAAEARRRSSAVAPHHAAAAAHASHGYHSGHNDANALQPIQSNVDDDNIRPSTERTTEPHATTNTTTTTTTTTTAHGAHGDGTGHTHFYQEATRDLDSVAPDERA